MPASRILIVEDQREVSRLLRSALETLEHEISVTEIPSGEEAILYSSRNIVDLLVTDFRLPGMTGIELMGKIRKYHPAMKVILITGQTDPKIRSDVANAGADAFFIKPVPMADFLDSVERHLGLVETMLPPEPINRTVEAEVQLSLPDLLAKLRQGLDAIAVLLIEDNGRVIARAGELPDTNDEISLLSSLLSVHSAGEKISRLIGRHTASNCFIFTGETYDMIFAPVGRNHSMLVMGKDLAQEAGVIKAWKAFSAASALIVQKLEKAPPGISAVNEPPTIPYEGPEHGSGEMEPLFTGSRKKLKPADINDFWEKAADAHKSPAKPDMLSYEQARQLGLTPKDEN